VEVALRHDRPAFAEVLGILALCALLLVGLAKMDNSAASREAHRAQAVLAAQAAAAARKPKEKEKSSGSSSGKNGPVTARTESLGSRGPIAIPVGAAWSPGTSASVAHSHPVNNNQAVHTPEVPAADLRRIVGPISVSDPVPIHDPPADESSTSQSTSRTERRDAVKVAQRAPAPTARTPLSPSTPFQVKRNLLLTIMAACGFMMCVGGMTILRRAR
jgi:hypothetical protein